METYLFIIGRSPELSIEELLVVLKPLGHIIEVTDEFVVFQGVIDVARLLPHLGGTIKIGVVHKVFENWNELTVDVWLHVLRSEIHHNTGRFIFGASVYGVGDQARRHVRANGLSLKKHLRTMSIPARFIINDEGRASSVLVTKNNLLGKELLLASGKKCYVGLTQAVQDFDAYGLRDYGRPARNMQRGMLPPKLAQIMLNLARVKSTDRLLDPFCGGGTIIQEALLLGIPAVWGSDKDSRAIDESRVNSEWLTKHFNVGRPTLSVVDVLDLEQKYERNYFDVIVTEPYLGPARLLRQSRLTRAHFQEIIDQSQKLYAELFKELHGITSPHARAVVIFPVFNLFNELRCVGDFDRLQRYGWKIITPAVTAVLSDPHLSPRGQLMYSREDQIVGREITVWDRAA